MPDADGDNQQGIRPGERTQHRRALPPAERGQGDTVGGVAEADAQVSLQNGGGIDRLPGPDRGPAPI
jgi:hypothetical protein